MLRIKTSNQFKLIITKKTFSKFISTTSSLNLSNTSSRSSKQDEGSVEEKEIKVVNPYSRVQEGFQSIFKAASNEPSLPVNKFQSYPRRTQRQTLSNAEASQFARLLKDMIPTTGEETSNNLDAFSNRIQGNASAASKIRKAISKTPSSTRAMWERRARTSLTTEEEARLDQMREAMLSFRTDLELLQWSMSNVFGFSTNASNPTLFPEHRVLPSSDSTTPLTGPSSPLYPELLVILFLLLRDTHLSPHSALHIFQLASLTAESYILGCTTTLYNEVLRTRWLEGDVETVANGLEEMRSGGVKIDTATKSIIDAIGEAIRIDEMRAEKKALQLEEALTFTSQIESEVLDSYRFFSPAQIRAWGKMEKIVEEFEEEAAKTKLARDNEKQAIYEAKRAREERDEIDRAKRESPDLFFSTDIPIASSIASSSSSSIYSPSVSSSSIGGSSSSRIYKDRGGDDFGMSERREEEVQDQDSDTTLNRGRRLRYNNYADVEKEEEEEDDNDDKIDSSWNNYPLEVFPRGASSSSSSSTPYVRSSRLSRNELNEFSASFSSSSATPSYGTRFRQSRELERSRDNSRNSYNEFSGDESLYGDDESTYRAPLVREARNRSDVPGENVVRVIDGVVVLPRRPSAVNPYKIRRKALTKIEKARYDTPHPMLAWKKS